MYCKGHQDQILVFFFLVNKYWQFYVSSCGEEKKVTTSFVEQKAWALTPATWASNPEALQSAQAKETTLSQKIKIKFKNARSTDTILRDSTI